MFLFVIKQDARISTTFPCCYNLVILSNTSVSESSKEEPNL
ncbi:hypothetical protein [Ehrlichia ruminantium]|nr:hypothetical protein [Ehrlichia ruminantium]